MKRQIAFVARALLVRANRNFFLFQLNCGLYSVFELIVRAKLCSTSGMLSAYLAHGRSSGDTFPGLSDFDLVLVFDEKLNANYIDEIRTKWNKLRQFLPVRDVSIFRRQDFLDWQAFGGGMDPLDELVHWRLLAGKDLRGNELLDLDSTVAERDRQRYAFASYFCLLRVVIKDEPYSSLLIISLRRQLYKLFISTVTTLHRKHLQVRQRSERLDLWAGERKTSAIASRLRALRAARFHHGEVSKLSFEVAAEAYIALRNVSQQSLISLGSQLAPSATEAAPDSTSPENMASADTAPINLREIIARARRLCTELVRDNLCQISAVALVSNGSPRGYTFNIVLPDALEVVEVVKTLRHVHTIFRMFDDPWFNEHYPAAVPLVVSESMWQRSRELWESYDVFFREHPTVLFGKLASVVPTHPPTKPYLDILCSGERAALSRYYNQLLLERSKPALFEFMTLNLPRLVIERSIHRQVCSNVDAVKIFAEISPAVGSFSRSMLEDFGRLDIDALLRDIPDHYFSLFQTEIRALLNSEHNERL